MSQKILHGDNFSLKIQMLTSTAICSWPQQPDIHVTISKVIPITIHCVSIHLTVHFGVFLTSNRKFTSHINNKQHKANHNLEFCTETATSIRRQTYSSLISQHWYCAIPWNPHEGKLKQINARVVRFNAKKYINTPGITHKI